MMYDHKWKALTDLPEEHDRWADGEMRHLVEIWHEQREILKNSKGLQEFIQQFNRRWAIETGILENIYSLDRGVTILLIEHGFDASLLDHNASDIPVDDLMKIIGDHHDSLDGLFSFVTGEREFSTNYICELHQQLLANQPLVVTKDSQGDFLKRPLRKGAYKLLPNNPVIPGRGLHEYCPPEQVASEMDNLVSLHGEHERKNVSPEVSAAWLHHRFTQIHPFEDGNGRVARAIASLVFIKHGLFPLLITRDDRVEYLAALENADQGDLVPLVKLFAKNQRKSILKALSISEVVLSQRTTITKIIEASKEQIFKRRQAELNRQMSDVMHMVPHLVKLADDRLRAIADEMTRSISVADPGFAVRADSCSVDGEKRLYYKRQVIEIAQKFDYYADIGRASAWNRLMIYSPNRTRLIFSYHGVGRSFSGVMVCTAFLEQESTDTDGDREIADFSQPAAMMEEPFQFSCRSEIAKLKEPFERWLNDVIVLALEHWRKQL